MTFTERNTLITQSCLTLCDRINCSPPGSSVLGIPQARMLEWIVIPFSRGTSQPRDWTLVFCVTGRFFTVCTAGKLMRRNTESWMESRISIFFHRLPLHPLAELIVVIRWIVSFLCVRNLGGHQGSSALLYPPLDVKHMLCHCQLPETTHQWMLKGTRYPQISK